MGQVIDEVISSRGEALAKKREKEFFDEVAENVKNLKEEKLDKTYLGTEEFHDVFIRILENAKKTRQKEKINLYAKIVAGVASIDLNKDEHYVEGYLNIIESLGPREIIILIAICNNKNILENSQSNWINLLAPALDKLIDIKDLDYYLQRLSYAGLIKEAATAGAVGYPTESYEFTTVFYKMAEFFKDNS